MVSERGMPKAFEKRGYGSIMPILSQMRTLLELDPEVNFRLLDRSMRHPDDIIPPHLKEIDSLLLANPEYLLPISRAIDFILRRTGAMRRHDTRVASVKLAVNDPLFSDGIKYTNNSTNLAVALALFG